MDENGLASSARIKDSFILDLTSLPPSDRLLLSSSILSNERIALFFSDFPFPCWIKALDTTNRLIMVANNKVYREMFGIGVLTWSTMQQMEDNDIEVLLTGKSLTFEATFTSPNKKNWEATVTKYPLINPTGVPVGVAGFMNECSEVTDSMS